MRTLRYLGVLVKTGLRGEEADKFLGTVKSMPELLGVQEKNYFIKYGISLERSNIQSREEALDLLKGLGMNVFIAEKTKLIKDESQRRKKVKELILRLGRIKVLFNADVDKVTGIISKFSRLRMFNEVMGFGKYFKTMEEDGLRVESKFAGHEEYFVVTEL